MTMFRSRRRKIERLDFILAGAQKSGTTALHYFLSKHPNITMGDQHEIHWTVPLRIGTCNDSKDASRWIFLMPSVKNERASPARLRVKRAGSLMSIADFMDSNSSVSSNFFRASK